MDMPDGPSNDDPHPSSDRGFRVHGGYGMHRLVLAVGAIGAIGVSAVLATVVSAAAAQPSAVPAKVSFSLSGSVAGGVKSAQVNNQVTFVFKENNTGDCSAMPPFLILASLANA